MHCRIRGADYLTEVVQAILRQRLSRQPVGIRSPWASNTSGCGGCVRHGRLRVPAEMTDTRGAVLPESIGHAVKYLLLGKPMISDQLKNERLSNPGRCPGSAVSRAISSSAYGAEESLIELLPYAGLAAFMLLLPITGVMLLILVVVTASYRQVVMAYTGAGDRAGRAGQFRPTGHAGCCGGVADRLRGDGGGAIGSWHSRGGLGHSPLGTVRPGDHPWRRAGDVLCRPAWASARGRALVCGAHLCLHPRDDPDDPDRGYAGSHVRPADLRSAAHERSRGDPSGQRADDGCIDPGIAAGLCQWWFIAYRRRGDFQHGQCFPETAGLNARRVLTAMA